MMDDEKVTCPGCGREGSMDLPLGDCINNNEPHCQDCCKKERPENVTHRWKPFPENF